MSTYECASKDHNVQWVVSLADFSYIGIYPTSRHYHHFDALKMQLMEAHNGQNLTKFNSLGGGKKKTTNFSK
jgi:hypothetical protein